MKLLFPSHPLKPREPDLDFESEFNAAHESGFVCQVYSLETLRESDASLAARMNVFTLSRKGAKMNASRERL